MNPPLATMHLNGKKTVARAADAPRFRTDWLSGFLVEVDPDMSVRTSSSDLTAESPPSRETTVRNPESELRRLSDAQFMIQEMERKRIATDLHDSIGQSLSALSCGIGAALNATRRGQVEFTGEILMKLAAQVKDTIIEVQRIAMNLRPATLDDIGLVGTLTWFFREFRSLHPDMTLITSIEVSESDIHPVLRTNIFRVVQEAVNNVISHAQAKEIDIRLKRMERELQLEVIDNGIGFATGGDLAPGTSQGFGLKGMCDRAEFSGGRFCLASKPGTGTRVLVAWPLLTE
jgi:signal transduction histidine kinase